MDNVKRYSGFIKRIVTAPDSIRKRLLQSSNLKIIKAICEVILNIRHNNIAVFKQVLVQLKRHKKVLQKLLSAKGFEARKVILVNNSKVLVALAAVFK